MEAHLEQLDPESDRYRVLSSARQFKVCWVELGERLTQVREVEGFRAWGYASFEAYCRRELQLKPDVANKLTRSFSFLRDHEPDLLKDRSTRELPALDVVDLLSQAKERTKISDENLNNLRDEVFKPEAKKPTTRAAVMKKIREQDPEAFKPAPKPAAEAPAENDLRKALLLSERLESLLVAQGEAVSKESLAHARSVVAELRERFAQTRRQGAA